MRKRFFYGYIIVIGCFLIEFVDAASLTTLSIFLPEFVRDLSISYTSASGIFVFGMMTGFLGGMLAAKIIPILTPKWSIFIGTICLSLSCWMNAAAHSLLTLYISSIVAGLSLPLVGPASFGYYVNQWFFEKRGSMLGIIYSGAAFGTAFWLLVLGQIISLAGWRLAQIVMGFACLIICSPIPILVLKSPGQANQSPCVDGTRAVSQTQSSQFIENDGLSFREAIRTSSFWCFILAMAFAHGAFFGHQYYAIPYMQLCGMSVTSSSAVTSLENLLKVIFTLMIGRLLDGKKPERTLLLCFSSFIIGIAVLLAWGTFYQNFVSLPFISILFISLAKPIQTSGTPTLISRIFGTKGYIKISAITSAVTNLFAALSSFLLGFVQDQTGNMTVGFILVTIPMIIGMILALFALTNSEYFRKETTP